MKFLHRVAIGLAVVEMITGTALAQTGSGGTGTSGRAPGSTSGAAQES
jgi:hypothetical protein